MISEHQSKNKKILLAISVLILVGGISYVEWSKFSHKPYPVYCTQEAKQCPDGSYVGRTGPRCEFSACPAEGAEQTWKTSSDLKLGVSFKYPEKFTTEYIQPVDWPPQVQIINEPFVCTEGGFETARAGKTEKRTVDGRTYCVTKVSEGAAGSIYTQYAYAASSGEKHVILTFSFRFVQCDNYDESKKTACEGERDTFDIDGVIDRIIKTITFIPAVTQDKSGIKGIVLLGPICPIVKDPPDEACADRPYQATLVVMRSDGKTEAARFTSDAAGKFRVSIQPGDYVVASLPGSSLPHCGESVKVAAGKFTEIVVHCDSGIR